MLSLARSESRHPLVFERLDLTELARETSFDLLRLANDRRIDLGFEGDETVVVPGEPTLIRELLANLVHNAISHTPCGGRVTVSVMGGTGAGSMQVDAPRVEIVDDGPGIDPGERARAFERFHRGAGAQAGTGSGLGLAIAKEICDRHGVRIALQDGPDGRGLRVVLEWPRQG